MKYRLHDWNCGTDRSPLTPVAVAHINYINALARKATQSCDQCGRKAHTAKFTKQDGNELDLCAACTRGANEGMWLPLLAWPSVEMQGGK